MKRALMLAAALTGLTVFSGAAMAQQYAILDMIGYLYESDNNAAVQGFPPSDPGDVLAGLGFIDGVNQPLTWSTDDYEYTWVLDGLVSTGAIDLGGGRFRVSYTGGTIDIVADEFMGAGYTHGDYGIDPPQAAAINTFSNGIVYLQGAFTYFVMTFDTNLHVGNFEGHIVFELGPYAGPFEELANPNGLTIAGVIDIVGDATIPDGYDLEADGHIYVDPTVPTETASWGGIKNLYR
jgi:hypothetical protein